MTERGSTIDLIRTFQFEMPAFNIDAARPSDTPLFERLSPKINEHSPLFIADSLSLARQGTKMELIDSFLKGTVYPTLIDLIDSINRSDLPGGIIVKVRQLTDFSLSQPEKEALTRMVKILKGKKAHEVQIWLVEEDNMRFSKELSFEDKTARLKLLGEIGLVQAEMKVDSVTRQVYSTGRPEKVVNKNKNKLSGKRYVGTMRDEAIRELADAGWGVVSTKEIDDRLEASSMPPEDLRKLKDGFGVVVHPESCNCLFRIDLKGEVTQIYQCPSEHEENPQVYEKAAPVMIGDKLPTKYFCDCKAPIFLRTRDWGSSNGKHRVGWETYCEHCGLRSCGNRAENGVLLTRRKLLKVEEEK